jgi:hypothetical protein
MRGETWSEVITEVQGLMSAGRRPGRPTIALTSEVLPAFTCPIIVTLGSNARRRRRRSRIAGSASASPTRRRFSSASSTLRRSRTSGASPL